MSHMKGQITENIDWLEVESMEYGTSWVLAEYAPYWPIPMNVEVPSHFINEELLKDIIQFTDISVEDVDCITFISGYGVRVRPGYLDYTEWTVFSTRQEAQKYLDDAEKR